MTLFTACKTIQEPTFQTMVDYRDGQKYSYKKIDGRYWLMENMRYNIAGSKWNSDSPDTLFGRLYNWHQAVKACPDGWVLSSNSDWLSLERMVTVDSLHDDLNNKKRFRGNNVEALKSKKYWNIPGTDILGINLLPAGRTAKPNGFFGLGKLAFFWTATPHLERGGMLKELAQYRYLNDDSTGLYSGSHWKENHYYSCRCVQYPENKAKKVTEEDKQTFVDSRDGQRYGYVKIKDYYWMTENMRYNEEASDFNPANPDSSYGRLYANFQALNACPKGWRLPSEAAWLSLESSTLDLYQGEIVFSEQFRGKNVKVLKAKTGWKTAGTDQFALNVLPAGKSSLENGFAMLGTGAYFWVYNKQDVSFSARHIHNDESGIYRSKEIKVEDDIFMSCRCVKRVPKNERTD